MKALHFVVPFALLAAACGSHSTESSDKITVHSDDGKTTASANLNAVSGNDAEEMNRKMEALKKLTPMSTDQLKTYLPEELNGMKRTSISVNSMTGLSAGHAVYKINDTSDIEIGITDCAGDAGSAFYAMNYATKMNFTSENDDGYFKVVDLNGKKATEGYSKNSSRYNLMFLAKDRILVSVEGKHASLADVRKTAEDLDGKVQ